jgi:hypothetical protein
VRGVHVSVSVVQCRFVLRSYGEWRLERPRPAERDNRRTASFGTHS